MRVVAGETPGWSESHVFFNGKELRFCYFADDETGEVGYEEGEEVEPGRWVLKECVCSTCGNNHTIHRRETGKVVIVASDGFRGTTITTGAIKL